MKQRIYLDTSVIGGAFDEEFKKITIQLFEIAIAKKITLVISEICATSSNAAIRGIMFFPFALAATNKCV